jgi:predicted RNase H-like HicB family nuclease
MMNAIEILKKPYARMVTPDTDGTFLAEIVEFPGCFATGKSASEALHNLESVAVDWIETALEQGQDIPEPMESIDYSGKLVLRMPKNLHKRAALWADREGVSLNKFIVTCVAEHVGMLARPAVIYTQPVIHTLGTITFGITTYSVPMQQVAASGEKVVVLPTSRRREGAYA